MYTRAAGLPVACYLKRFDPTMQSFALQNLRKIKKSQEQKENNAITENYIVPRFIEELNLAMMS